MINTPKSETRISKLSFPQDNKGRVLLLISVLLGFLLYVERAQTDEILSKGRGAGFILLFLSPLYCLWGIGMIYSIVTVIKYGFSTKGNWFPVLVFVGILALSYVLPLPPLPEKTFFLEYRQEFEHVIQLVQTEGLPPGITQCQAPDAYELPNGYKHLTARCVFVYEGKVVEFSPTKSTFSVVYVDEPENLSLSWDCSVRGYVWEQLEDQWYICVDADD